MLFVGCEADSLGSENDLEPVDCLQQDCITGTNENVEPSYAITKSVIPIEGLQNAYAGSASSSEHSERFTADGFPAWNQIASAYINSEFRHYAVPVYAANSTHVEAVISFVHYFNHGKVRVDYIDRTEIGQMQSYYGTTLENKHGESVTEPIMREAAVFQLSVFDKDLFGSYQDDILSYLSENIRSEMFNKDCNVTTKYAVFTCQEIVGGENMSIAMYTSCSTSTLYVTTTSNEVGCGGGGPRPGGPSGGGVGSGGSGGGINTGGDGGPSVIVISTDPNDPNNRCIEDGVGCDDEEEEEEEFVVSLDDTPGDKPIEVFDNKCDGLTELWNMSGATGHPEVFGVLTQGGNFLITQVIGGAGGQVNGLFKETNAITGVETTFYFYPSSEDLVSLPGDDVVSTPQFHFVPIQATIHSHSPCQSDGTDGITDRTVSDDQSFASSFPGVNHYILGCGAIGQFSQGSSSAFNVNMGSLTSLCNYFN